MKLVISTFSLVFALLSAPSQAGDIAVLGEPLKDSYALTSGFKEFYRTGKTADSYSMICNMGQAIPDPKKDGWYTNKPIAGLTLELRARLVAEVFDEYKPMGFVVIVKNGDVLVNFKPVGEVVNGGWDGDVFSSWSGTSTDVEVSSGRLRAYGYVYFDLMDGNGFYYKGGDAEKPEYFLSQCRRIKKTGLPVYDWRY